MSFSRMNVPLGRSLPGLTPDWILAPVYSDQLSNALPLWRTHHSPEISLSLPKIRPHPPFPAVQTLIGLDLPKPHQYNDRQEVKEFPFAVVKPKAIRLYDIHIGVESRLPIAAPGPSFDLPLVSNLRNLPPPCFPIPSTYRDDKEDLKQVSALVANERTSCFSPMHGKVYSGTTPHANIEKTVAPSCYCYQRSGPDSGRSASQTPVSAQELYPLCMGLSAQPQTAISVQFPNVFEPPAFPVGQQPFPSSTRYFGAQDVQRPEDFTAMKRSDHHRCGAPNDRFISLHPSLAAVYGGWNNLKEQQTIRPRYSTTNTCNLKPKEINKNHTVNGIKLCQQVVEDDAPYVFSFKERSSVSGSQKHFPHYLEAFLKDESPTHSQISPKSRVKKEERSDICSSRDIAATTIYYSNSFSDRNTGIAKRSRKSENLFSRRSKSATELTKCLKRTNKLNEHVRSRKIGNKSNCAPTDCHKNLTNEYFTNEGKLFPFKDKYSRRIGARPLPETKSLGQGRAPGTSSSGERRLFRCPQCRYVTDRKNNLKRHIVTMHHTSNKTLECCGIGFHNKAALRDHNSVFHKGGYSCSLCGRNFCRKALLRRHLAVHSGQKDFFCDQCGYATSHKSNLERHLKVHSKKEDGSREMEQMSNADVTNLHQGRQFCDGRKLSGSYVSYVPHGTGHNSRDLTQQLLCPNTEYENMESENQREQCVSPERSSCDHCCVEVKRKSNVITSSSNSFEALKFTNSRGSSVHKARRSRGVLSKRIQDTYMMNRSRSNLKIAGPNCISLQNTCLKDQNGINEKVCSQDPHKVCDISSTSVDEKKEMDTCSKQGNSSYGSGKNQLEQDDGENVPERPQNQSSQEVFDDNNPPKIENKGPSTLAKRSKQDVKRRMCEVQYPCRECGHIFSTQSKFGQHECLSIRKTSPFNLSLVTAYQKSCAKDV